MRAHCRPLLHPGTKATGRVLALLCALLGPGCSYDLYRQPPDASGSDGTLDQAPMVDVRNDHGAQDGPSLDKAVPRDGAIPDRTLDQSVLDKTVSDQVILDKTVPDKTVPDQFVCPVGSVLDEAMGSNTGWVQMVGSSAATIMTAQIYVPTNQYASVLHSDPAGLVCVPPGKGLTITLTATCASGKVSVALYDVYCTKSSCNMKTAAKACSLTCNSSSQASYSCTATAQEVGGRWIYAARVGRSALGGSTASFTHLKLAVP